MSVDRRAFLGAAGLCALAVTGTRSLEALAGTGRPETAPQGRRVPRWGMVVDLRRCLQADGCTDCIAACERAHNVPRLPSRAHEVKWIWREPYERAFAQRGSGYADEALRGKLVPVLCNHCDNPPCVRVCPVKATWKREDGIVMMDWHRCIGCRYCMAACPYGARSFNWLDPRPRVKEVNPDFPTRTRGVVEKCNFCEERLAQGRGPACVEACRERALAFGDLRDPGSQVREQLRSRHAMRRKPELGTEPSVYYRA
ncbi:MAG: 4Fe-4S dicluster domain-containing protein [Candidatus Rokubacteria bacterium]|nr:4Fe-4S dicluster domain-containing protein [Candidatus Rokubacteria bacterium]